MFRRFVIPVVLVVFAGTLWAGCQTLREVANLRHVDFGLGNVVGAELAGVNLSGIQTYGDLRTQDIVQVGAALSQGHMPLRFQLNVQANNPQENGVQARMVRFDWMLLIEDRETVSGVVNENFVLPSGETRTIPLQIELDLLEFFDRSARDLVNLVMAFAGTGEPTNIAIRAQPTIDTPVGPIRYPNPITIASRDVGAQ